MQLVVREADPDAALVAPCGDAVEDPGRVVDVVVWTDPADDHLRWGVVELAEPATQPPSGAL